MRQFPKTTAPQETPPNAEAPLAPLCSVFRRFLRQQGLKYTPERAATLQAIIDRDSVFEIEELRTEMQDSGHRISKATIYRTINLLVEAGIITEALFDSKQSHYRLAYGQESRDFILCVRTGQLLEFGNEELIALREKICKQHGWTAVGHRFQIYGISPEDGDDSATTTDQ